MESRIGFSLLARTFEIILYVTLQRLMGLNSLILDGRLVFGTRTIFVLFRTVKGALELRVFKMILLTSSPIISQYFW